MKNLSNLLGIILISVSIVSRGKELREYPFNVQQVSDISPSDLEIIISYEEECEEIRGRAKEVQDYGEWKIMMTKMCERNQY